MLNVTSGSVTMDQEGPGFEPGKSGCTLSGHTVLAVPTPHINHRCRCCQRDRASCFQPYYSKVELITSVILLLSEKIQESPES